MKKCVYMFVRLQALYREQSFLLWMHFHRWCCRSSAAATPVKLKKNPPQYCHTAHSSLCVCARVCAPCASTWLVCMLDLNDNRGTDPERRFTAATLFPHSETLSFGEAVPPFLSASLMFTPVPWVTALRCCYVSTESLWNGNTRCTLKLQQSDQSTHSHIRTRWHNTQQQPPQK